MKIKSFMTMTLAAVAFVFSMGSCSSSDDEPEVAVAAQVAGSYSGNEVVVVMGEESSNETKTYVLAKSSDASVDMTIPEMGMGGHMTIPALAVKNIPLTKSGNTITGKFDKYEGVVTNAAGDEKNYTISNLALVSSDKTVAVTFSLKYGNMPMSMETTFTGTKK
ncbi:MAG: hypothetical protein J6W38_12430 [Prevotella sp.]|jgi:hypothetical protein|nr:hypothetical protein [Prevotella sp.]MBO7128701.1 hypothetical protein [Prevotella sp.]